jgi:tetratricopeptide (TPR) repeat protein
MRFLSYASLLCIMMLLLSCRGDAYHTRKMKELLQNYAEAYDTTANFMSNRLKAAHFRQMDSLQQYNGTQGKTEIKYQAAVESLRAGETAEAIRLFNELLKIFETDPAFSNTPQVQTHLREQLALSHLRLGEQQNCLINHTSASCIMPIQQAGFHQLEDGSREAIGLYTGLLDEAPDRWDYRWLLNIAHMTLGEYPEQVDPRWLLPDSIFRSDYNMPRFEDIAGGLGVDVNGLSGGVVIEDFDGDGYLDIMTSSWGMRDQLRFFHNNGDGTFADQTEESNLIGIIGGLNMVHADYNNDGHPDVLVLRGAWMQQLGRQPNSLLKNNGDGTFSDVTGQAGLLTLHPTQTATWNDFNRDGWLDLFIGNESDKPSPSAKLHPSELFINNQDGTFTDVANTAGVELLRFVKGVTSGDYDRDGWPDLYVSTYFERNYLLRNEGNNAEGIPTFADVTEQAGLDEPMNTFPTWFWDYDNDGWLDIFVSEFDFLTKTQAKLPPVYNVAAHKMGKEVAQGKPRLYRNLGDGTFEEVAAQSGLDEVLYTMGSNFGDLDNDGWLDMYLGTGDPEYSTLVPNKAFRNAEGKFFQDVTSSTGLGHLQKGHAIALADLDHDGDQDIYANMGGAYEGDVYRNALFENPTQGGNHWLKIRLEGTESNRLGVGAMVRLVVQEEGKPREIYRQMNTGGSFGSNPLRLEVGLGQATVVDTLEITWPLGGKTQVFAEVLADQMIKITEGEVDFRQEACPSFQFKQAAKHEHPMM